MTLIYPGSIPVCGVELFPPPPILLDSDLPSRFISLSPSLSTPLLGSTSLLIAVTVTKLHRGDIRMLLKVDK